MPLRDVEFDAAGAGDTRTAHLAKAMLETFRHYDLDAVRCACDRVLNRLVRSFEHARYRDGSAAARNSTWIGAKIGSSIFDTINVKI